MNSDPIIEEVRSVRRKISASYDHDPARMIADHVRQQARFANRLVTREQLQGRRRPLRPQAKRRTKAHA